MGALLVAAFDGPADFLAAYDAEVTAGGLFVPGAELPAGGSSACTLRVYVAGDVAAELVATIASATPGMGVAVIFLDEPAALHELAARYRAPAGEPAQEAPASDEAADAAPEESAEAAAAQSAEAARAEAARRPLQERIREAQAGSREERMRMLRSTDKQLHVFVLKNPRLTLEEVQWAARLVTLAPEALKLIADHAEWAANPGVAAALIKNPKTPLPSALKLLQRLPEAELRALARSNGPRAIVQAARRKVMG